jgi:hypothetical protein
MSEDEKLHLRVSEKYRVRGRKVTSVSEREVPCQRTEKLHLRVSEKFRVRGRKVTSASERDDPCQRTKKSF